MSELEGRSERADAISYRTEAKVGSVLGKVLGQ
jgi:hypothetical protein